MAALTPRRRSQPVEKPGFRRAFSILWGTRTGPKKVETREIGKAETQNNANTRYLCDKTPFIYRDFAYFGLLIVVF